MSVSTHDFERTQGDTHPFTVTMTDEAGVAIDIAGFSFRFTVTTKESPEDDTFKLFQIVGVIVTPSTNGQVEFTPLTADVAHEAKTYYYDIQQNNGSGELRTVLKGKWEVEAQRTFDAT